MSKTDTDPRFESGCGVPIKKGFIAIAIFYALAALLNAQGLLRRATLMQYDNPVRALCVALAEPTARLSHFLCADRMRNWIETNIELEE